MSKYTVERIRRLVNRLDLPHPEGWRKNLHEILNMIDSAIGADTEWLSSLECSCLWHIGKTCNNRRAVGARLKMIEETLALNDLKQQFAVG